MKRIDFNKLYFTDKEIEVFAEVPQDGYTHFGHLKKFTETHPASYAGKNETEQLGF